MIALNAAAHQYGCGTNQTRRVRVAYPAYARDQDAVIVKQRLNEPGYSGGQNLLFEFRSAQGAGFCADDRPAKREPACRYACAGALIRTGAARIISAEGFPQE